MATTGSDLLVVRESPQLTCLHLLLVSEKSVYLTELTTVSRTRLFG